MLSACVFPILRGGCLMKTFYTFAYAQLHSFLKIPPPAFKLTYEETYTDIFGGLSRKISL